VDIEFQGQYDRGMLQRAVALGNTPSTPRLILRWLLVALAVFGLVFIVVYVATSTELNWLRVGRLLIGYALLAYFALQPFLAPRRMAAQLWKRLEQNPTCTGRITGTGISFAGEYVVREIAWDRIMRVRKSGDLVVLLTADRTLTIMSRSFFANDADWQRFQQLVDYRVKEAK
jgi:hypothetical protein